MGSAEMTYWIAYRKKFGAFDKSVDIGALIAWVTAQTHSTKTLKMDDFKLNYEAEVRKPASFLFAQLRGLSGGYHRQTGNPDRR
jgi:hypothetical protein